MAGLSNMKFWHVVVMEGYNTIFDRKCLTIQEANMIYDEKKKEYQGQPKFNVSKELF
jgi:hypothetical protein